MTASNNYQQKWMTDPAGKFFECDTEREWTFSVGDVVFVANVYVCDVQLKILNDVCRKLFSESVLFRINRSIYDLLTDQSHYLVKLQTIIGCKY